MITFSLSNLCSSKKHNKQTNNIGKYIVLNIYIDSFINIDIVRYFIFDKIYASMYINIKSIYINPFFLYFDVEKIRVISIIAKNNNLTITPILTVRLNNLVDIDVSKSIIGNNIKNIYNFLLLLIKYTYL